MASTQDLERAEIQKWLEDFHAASATLSASHWCNNFFAPSIILQFGNGPPVQGLEALRDMFFAPQLSRLDLMEHYIEYFDYVPPRIYQAARIKYRVKGDDPSGKDDVEIPGFATLYVREDGDGDVASGDGGNKGRLICYRMETFLDTRPLEKRMQEVFEGKERSQV
ncbi:uncharacterized protein Z519_09458 [Cladophialophora bantiana CBS 173.52]|uniref:SnoaL-like domain-containing protein n=1 Tax=Cladophialophora bantiana (strain ATCC 10958 / CBS 173.52 / CDC B-1940 / NIH 8579) TaxID=1442370 RepID=A0A0D2H9Z6_CLAB1|nr:uncharacterized protein Z519_09458 [Cladophialophora bantiana CBS 173.52]KIW90028.1 hypothetical protein Z519_09458 [Cladophialophora bantiana CBS 173.52]